MAHIPTSHGGFLLTWLPIRRKDLQSTEAMLSGFKPQTRCIKFIPCVISGFNHEEDATCALMGYYAACIGKTPAQNTFRSYPPQKTYCHCSGDP